MVNQALPRKSEQLLRQAMDDCQNLGLILDKYAPWASVGREQWDLSAKVRQRSNRDARVVTGGEAKGHWLKYSHEMYDDESPSIFLRSNNDPLIRTDKDLMQACQNRWLKNVEHGKGKAVSLRLSDRMIAGLGASNVLETGLTLERNTGLPYLPGSTVKGLARAWGLIEVAAQFNLTLDDQVDNEGYALNVLSSALVEPEDKKANDAITTMLSRLPNRSINEEAGAYVDFFRLIFGTQGTAGAIDFLDAIYYGKDEPVYATDVMTPHYVQYYTQNGGAAPAEDDSPNPVSFLTVDAGNVFAFGLVPRLSATATLTTDTLTLAMDTTHDWLVKGLSRLGVGSKTAAGYGFFSRKSAKILTE
jgi:CRISPR-associated protein Cmr6